MSGKKIRKGILHRAASVMLAVMVAMTFTLMDTQPASAASKPGKVGGVHAKAVSQTQIQIGWKAVKKAKGYEVYRGKKLVKRTTAKKFTEKKLKPDTTYKYKVRAYKFKKQKQWYNKKTKKWVTKKPKKKYRGKKRTKTVRIYGKFSRVVTAKTKAKPQTQPSSEDTAQKPAAPAQPAGKPLVITGLKAEMGYISAKISWNSAYEATQYRLSVNGEEKGVTSACTYTLTGLTPRTTYVVSVAAENGSDKGAAVEAKYITADVPVPSNIRTSSTKNSITLSWNAVPGAEDYLVDLPDGSYARVNNPSYTHTGLTPLTEYTFYLRTRVSGKYSWKLDAKVTVKTKKDGLPAPGHIKANTITSKTAVLTWDAVSGADSYRILDENKNVIDTVTTRSYFLKGLKENTSHIYYITAGKSGSYGMIDDENKAKFSTIETPRCFVRNANISLTYHGVKFCLGDTWTDTLAGKLKKASNGYVKVLRPGFISDPLTGDDIDATLHMFDINDYSDFLAVKVADGKIVDWDTNGPVFGTYYGTEIGWGDVLDEYMCGGNTAYRTSGSACDNVFTELDRGDTVIGGFSFHLLYTSTELIVENEKKIGFHYINAYRVAGGLYPLEYSDGLDGHNYTWSGVARNKEWVNTRYGAQALAETLAQNDAVTHITENFTKGPVAGQTLAERHTILKSATGIKHCIGENVSTGTVGECFLTSFLKSNGHFWLITDTTYVKTVGFGICQNGPIAEIFGD